GGHRRGSDRENQRERREGKPHDVSPPGKVGWPKNRWPYSATRARKRDDNRRLLKTRSAMRSRRKFLKEMAGAGACLVMAPPRLAAQVATPRMRVRGINHVTLSVSDVQGSLDFYQ